MCFINLNITNMKNLNAPYKHELAAAYGITSRTLYNWIGDKQSINEKLGGNFYLSVRKLTLKQVETLFEHYGVPEIYQNVQRVPLKPYSRTQLSKLFGMDDRTFTERLKNMLFENEYHLVFAIQSRNKYVMTIYILKKVKDYLIFRQLN